MASYPIVGGSALIGLGRIIKTTLSAYAPLSGITVYDSTVPEEEEPNMPYIVIGETTETNADIHNRSGRDVTITIHIHSDYLGTKQTKTIMGKIADVLSEASLSSEDDWAFVKISYAFGEVIKEGPRMFHGVMRFDVQCHKIPAS